MSASGQHPRAVFPANTIPDGHHARRLRPRLDGRLKPHLQLDALARAGCERVFEERHREEFFVVFLDTVNTFVGIHIASVGGLAASIVEPRQLFKAAVLANAAALLLAHDHPSGNPEPSREDVAVTKQLVEAGKLMGIPVHGHLIIAGRGYTSLAERGLM